MLKHDADGEYVDSWKEEQTVFAQVIQIDPFVETSTKLLPQPQQKHPQQQQPQQQQHQQQQAQQHPQQLPQQL